MYKIRQNANTVAPDVVEITADYRTDLEILPTDFGVGSATIVLEDGSVWMLGNDKKWHEI